jgi:hypothetical protein
MTEITTPGSTLHSNGIVKGAGVRSRGLGRALGAGCAIAALAGSLAGPAAGQFRVVPTQPANMTYFIAPDLQMEKFEVTDVGNGFWNLKATLRNGGSNPSPLMRTYPGGGKMRLKRATGGTTPYPAPFLFAAAPDPEVVLAERTLPPLARGQATTLEVWTKGRAIFSAVVDLAPGQNSLPEANPANNNKTVNKLISRQFNISTGQLEQYLGTLMGQFQIRLSKTDSFAKLPGFYESHWNLADVVMAVPQLNTNARWAVSDVKYHTAVISMGAQGRLALTLYFETLFDEVVGIAEGGPIGAVPHLNAGFVKAGVIIPLEYIPHLQYFACRAPQVSAESNLQILAPATDWVKKDFENKIKNAVFDLFSDEKVKQKISYELNRQIKQHGVPGGRIMSVDVNASYFKLHTEVAQ